MEINHPLLLSLLALMFLSACDCTNVDEFGQRPTIVVPIRSYPNQDSFSVGDTIWWEGDFSRDVEVLEVDQRLRLDNFDFMAQFNFQNIEVFSAQFDTETIIIPVVGASGLNPQDYNPYHKIPMVENEARYKFKFGVVLVEPGTFAAAISTLAPLYDNYDHPALYACKNTRRERFSNVYINSSTTRENYESIFIPSADSTLLSIATFERYRDVGGIFFVVTE